VKELELKLKTFLENCTCRNGLIPTITGIEKNAFGSIVSFKGTVSINEETIPLHWNSSGNVAGADALQFDLVETITINQLGQE
jgi:hypothetical protein